MLKAVLLVAGVLVLTVGALGVAVTQGWLSPFGVNAERKDSQVITAVERTQEVSLLSLAVQGLTSETRDREIFGQSVPGSGETVYIEYAFRAKLGLDGEQVDVRRSGSSAYVVSVPDFLVIGYDEPTFEMAVEDNGVLSWVTPDVDQLDMVNDVFDDDAQREYLDDQQSALEEQTKVFYDSLITGIDPDARITYEFAAA
jgi:hypothetical protein